MTTEPMERGGLGVVRPVRQDGWVESITRAARGLEDALGAPASRDVIVQGLVRIARDLDCQMVTGASTVGDQLAGLVVGRTGGMFKLWAKNGAEGTVLVIEGVLASGVQIAGTAARARRHGATRVVGAAVLADPAGLEVCRSLLTDEVVALGPIA